MMNESKQKILQMLQDGSITPEEADRLLLAVGNANWEGPASAEQHEGGDETSSPLDSGDFADKLPPPETAPDFEGLRESWQTPFNIALASTATFFVLAMALFRSTKSVLSFGGKVLLSLTLFAALVAAYIWSSRHGLWLHIRVQSADGSRFRISLPLSTRLVRWGMQTGREYVDEQTQEYMDMVHGMITAWEDNPNQDPLFIDIDDDGDKVQVFIG